MDRETSIPFVSRLVSLANTGSASKSGSDRWQAEHFRLLQRICAGIAARVEKGASANRELRVAARRWKGKQFRSGRPVRFSEGTLRRAFYAWKKAGPDALKLNYKGPKAKTSAELRRVFLEECVAPGVFSRAEVVRMLELVAMDRAEKLPSIETIYRMVPRALRAKVTALHRARRKVFHLAEQIRAGIQEGAL